MPRYLRQLYSKVVPGQGKSSAPQVDGYYQMADEKLARKSGPELKPRARTAYSNTALIPTEDINIASTRNTSRFCSSLCLAAHVGRVDIWLHLTEG